MHAKGLLVCAILVGCVHAQSPDESAAGKPTKPADDLSRWEASAPVMQAIASARSYWSASEPGYEEEVHVLATTTGAFTRADAEQRAVLYGMSVVPRGFPKRGLALLEGDRLVRNIAFVLIAEDLRALRDFDGNGRDELVFEGGFGMGGQFSRGVTIAAFGEEGLVELGTASVYESACGTGREGMSGPTSAKISVVPGTGLVIQRSRQLSCESETWEPIGGPEPLVLVPSEENPFEDLKTP